jgi:hypothetical protein
MLRTIKPFAQAYKLCVAIPIGTRPLVSNDVLALTIYSLLQQTLAR